MRPLRRVPLNIAGAIKEEIRSGISQRTAHPLKRGRPVDGLPAVGRAGEGAKEKGI